MTKLILLVVDTLLCALLILWFHKGKKYETMLQSLTEKDYPLKEMYGVGLAAQEKGLLAFAGEKPHEMVGYASLLYGKKYAEFYARVFWAQGITLMLVMTVVGLTVACNMEEKVLLYALFGPVLGIALMHNSINTLKERVQKRQDACMREFPDMCSKIALMVNAGMTIRNAWIKVAESKDSELYRLMREASEQMRNGVSEVDAIYQFGVLSNSPEIRKFVSVVIQGMEKGNRELADALAHQSNELWAMKRQHMLQRGEEAASQLILPVGLLFVGILIMIMIPVMNNVL